MRKLKCKLRICYTWATLTEFHKCSKYTTYAFCATRAQAFARFLFLIIKNHKRNGSAGLRA